MKTADALARILFDTLAYIDKLSGVESPYLEYSTSTQDMARGFKPPFLDGKKARGTYTEEVNAFLEIMYNGLVNFDDSLVRDFFRFDVNTRNFLVWLRCKENDVSFDGKILEAGDWRTIEGGQGADMGFIPERNDVLVTFNRGDWPSLSKKLFSVWRKRLEILASFRSDTVTEMILIYLGEEESRWTIKAS